MAALAFFGNASPVAVFVSRPMKSSIFSSPVGISNGHFCVLFMGFIYGFVSQQWGNAACWDEAGNTLGEGGLRPI